MQAETDAKLAEMSIQCQASTEAKDKAHDECEAIKKQLIASNQELQRALAKQDALKEQQSTHDSEARQAKASLADAVSSLADLKKDKANLQKSLDESLKERIRVQNDVDRVNCEKADLQHSRQQALDTNQKLQRELYELHNTVRLLKVVFKYVFMTICLPRLCDIGVKQ